MTNRDTLYLKLSCPFCLKVAALLAETGQFENVEIKAFWPGEEAELAIRAELATLVPSATFPTLRTAAGAVMADSDQIVEHYAALSEQSPVELPFYQYVLSGPCRRLRENFQEIKALKDKGIV